jgi:type VI secretion system secreted protein VgrG
MRAPDVVAAVLHEAGIAARFQLLHEHPVRDYCTQYDESDLRFVTRLLAESGIYFHFHAGPPLGRAREAAAPIPGDTLILGDDAAFYPALGVESLYFQVARETARPRADQITRFALRTRVRANAAHVRDYDPLRPTLPLDSKAESSWPFAGGERSEGRLEIYDHHGPALFPRWGGAGEEASRMLRQERREAALADGDSGCPDLAPGCRFVLRDHPAAHLDRPYVVTRVEHRGRSHAGPGEEIYENSFACAPAEVAFIPRRPKRRCVQVSLTATVVGPPGEEIHVDPLGQIQVQFPWDREGQGRDGSSCWIRTMHPWAGAGWGAQFIPRVGMEVVVVFEGGNPDKPMVLGALYNGTHPPPYVLPREKTRSGFRTRTSPGGGGGNELSFEDAAAGEQVYLHAQRDLDEVVQRRHTTRVYEDQENDVRGEQRNSVGGDQRERIGGDRHGEIRGHQTERVGGDRALQVDGDQETTVDGNREIHVRGTSAEVVRGDATLAYHDGRALFIEGHATTLVGTHGDHGKSDFHVFGDHVMGAEGHLTLTAKKSLTLQCGDSVLALTPEILKMGAAFLALAGRDGATLRGKGPALSLVDEAELVGKTVKIFSQGASVELGDDAHLRGRKVLVNCDTAKPAEVEEATGRRKTKPLELKLSDVDFVPYPDKAYKLLVDGDLYEGKTGPNGEVKQEIPEGATSATLILWVDEYPEGPRHRWSLSIEEIAPASAPAGAALRLRNLGYYTGDLDPKMKALPGRAAAALREFQGEHGLPRNGKLDGATAAKLAEVYGH